MEKIFKYFLLDVLFWVIVDFTTTNAIKDAVSYYSTYMPTILLFYIGCPLVFAFLIYKYHLSDNGLFIATIIEIVIVEIIFTRNPLFFTFPMMLLAIIVSLCIYCFLSFVPKWLIDGETQQHKRKIIILTLAWMVVTLLTAFGTG